MTLTQSHSGIVCIVFQALNRVNTLWQATILKTENTARCIKIPCENWTTTRQDLCLVVWLLTAHKFFMFRSGNIFTNPLTGSSGMLTNVPRIWAKSTFNSCECDAKTNWTRSDLKWARFTLPAVRETSFPEGSHTRHARLIFGGSKANMAVCQMRKGAKHQRTPQKPLFHSLSPLNSVKPQA